MGFITESFLDAKGKLVEGGAERQLLHLIGVARDLGADVSVYQRGPHTWQGNYEGIPVMAQPSRLSALGRTLGRRAVSDGCTHLHFQYLERVPWHQRGPRVTATAHAVYWDIPYVACYRQWYPGGMAGALALPAWRVHQLVRTLLAVGRCERVLTTDTTLLRIVQACRPAIRQRLEVVPNFTDLHDDVCDQSAGSTNPAMSELLVGRAQGHVVVLVPRNLSFVRGGAWLCQIVRLATDTTEGKQCHFFVTGVAVDVYGYASRYRKLFQDQVDALPAEARRRIHVLGGVPRAAMRTAYQASDIVLIPTFAHEGTSLAALEAMGAGVPVVATNVGGLNDVVQHGVTGLLVPPSPQALADALMQLAGDPGLRTRLGAEGQRLAMATFSHQRWRERAEAFGRRAGWAAQEVFIE